MKKAYVAGPYRAKTHYEIEQNIRRAEAVAIELWQKGYAVFCPHKNTAHFDGLCPDYVWLEGDLEWLVYADVLVLVPGWENSLGTLLEREEAERLGIEIKEWGKDEL